MIKYYYTLLYIITIYKYYNNKLPIYIIISTLITHINSIQTCIANCSSAAHLNQLIYDELRLSLKPLDLEMELHICLQTNRAATIAANMANKYLAPTWQVAPSVANLSGDPMKTKRQPLCTCMRELCVCRRTGVCVCELCLVWGV